MKRWIMPAFQTVIVVVILLSYYATTWFGEEFVLRAEPFDPWDPFYGEYVLLQYPDINQAAKQQNFEQGVTVYFTLENGEDGFAQVERIETESFSGAIQGTYYDSHVSIEQLEQFYVEQGRGPELEEAVDLQATIYVSPWGTIRPYDLQPRVE